MKLKTYLNCNLLQCFYAVNFYFLNSALEMLENVEMMFELLVFDSWSYCPTVKKCFEHYIYMHLLCDLNCMEKLENKKATPK